MLGRPEPFALGYRPALDGLRAIAVCAVLAAHAGWIGGGWLGVDVFFTLSDFLITALLLEEHARTGTLSIRRFYVRRARRLLPALVVLLLVWGPFFLVVTPAPLWPAVLGDLLGVLFYVNNWFGIYWMVGPLGHTWSLAIEEQFYLVWPVLLLGLVRWIRPRWMIAGLVIGAVASLAGRLVLALGAGAQFARVYVGTDTHADGLLLGAALAVWCCHRGGVVPLVPGMGVPTRPQVARAAGWVRAAGIAPPLALLGLLLAAPLVPGYVYGVTALAACATGGVILGILAGGSCLTRRALEARGLVWLGRISYGVYLWHWPVFGLLRVLPHSGEPTASFGRTLLAWGLTFAVASLSYWLVERPCLASKPSRLSIHRENQPTPVALERRTTENGAPALPAVL